MFTWFDEIRSATFLHLLTFFEASRFSSHVSHLCPSLTVVNCTHTLRWHCCVHIRQEMRSQLGGIVLRMIIWMATYTTLAHKRSNKTQQTFPNRSSRNLLLARVQFSGSITFYFFQYVICNHPKWWAPWGRFPLNKKPFVQTKNLFVDCTWFHYDFTWKLLSCWVAPFWGWKNSALKKTRVSMPISSKEMPNCKRSKPWNSPLKIKVEHHSLEVWKIIFLSKFLNGWWL